MMHEVIITGITAIVTAIISSWSTLVYSKKKFKVEVEEGELENLRKSLEFYKQVLDENQKLLKTYMHKVDESMEEIYSLKKAISELLQMSCIDDKCRKRKMLPERAATKIINPKKSTEDILERT